MKFWHRPVTQGPFLVVLLLIMVGAVGWGLIITGYQHDACLNRAEIIVANNALAREMIDIDDHNPVANPEVAARRQAAWEALILPELKC